MTKPRLLRALGATATTAAVFASLHAPLAHAADVTNFPSRTVRIVVPVAPGGSADKLTRTLAEKLSTLWGQSVVVENVAGASGTIGAARVAKAAPDGYTLLQQGEGITLNGILFKNLPYNTQKAFTPVIKAVVNPQILVVNPGTGLYTFADYLARAKSQPESISLGLPGNGGIAHVAHEILAQETGAKVNYIPYPGGGPATQDVLAGHTNATLITLAAVTEFVRAGRLRALAVTTNYRSAALPDVHIRGDFERWRRRSKLIRRLRVVLPATIGVILLSLLGFVVQTTVLGRDAAPAKADAPIELVNPRFVGKDEKGRAFVITASSAERDENDYQRVLLREPALVLDAEGESPSRVTAKTGVYSEDKRVLNLDGGVKMSGSNTDFNTQSSIFNTATGELEGQGQISGVGSLGEITAKSYGVYVKGERLVFKGGVRGRLDPK